MLAWISDKLIDLAFRLDRKLVAVGRKGYMGMWEPGLDDCACPAPASPPVQDVSWKFMHGVPDDPTSALCRGPR